MPGMQLNASTGSKQASINFGSTSTTPNWSVLLSSPLSTGSDSSGGSSATNTNIATLNGLANGFSGTFKLSFFRLVPRVAEKETQPLVNKALASCLAEAASAANLTEARKACNTAAAGELVHNYDCDDYDSYLEQHFGSPVSAVTGGLQAAVGYNSFTYYQPTSLLKSSQQDVPRSIGAYLGVAPHEFVAPTLIDISINYQQAYTAIPSATACKMTNGSISCQTGSIGAPKHTDKLLLSLDDHTEFRVMKQLFGVSPQVTYDPRNRQQGVDLPIYFIPDSKGNLIAGVEAGWTNTQHLTFGVIVGAPFSFFAQSK